MMRVDEIVEQISDLQRNDLDAQFFRRKGVKNENSQQYGRSGVRGQRRQHVLTLAACNIKTTWRPTP